MVQVLKFTKEAVPTTLYDERIDSAIFETPFAAALHLLHDCTPEQIRDLELYRLRQIKAATAARPQHQPGE